MYADDIFIFCKANLEEVGAVLECVQLFGSWFGQCLNVQKSAYICSKNVNEDTQAELSQFLGWRCKLLSQAGRSTLIRAVAQSSPVYSMATYLFPKTLCYKMDQAVQKF
ncbi:hypothetical protein G4B88_006269 [Cannabis sativa]|uniref:Reverse transcriptase domain-containing protein n=1 Tax=Cannabis sativa TaxID=3483 RepID=A0A7J6IBA7_CANSA|nr:hypothetical protein G4B88_006269 [Cannabis sativa]